MDLATQLPDSFAAGTTVKYRASLASLGYSASDGWSLKVFIGGPALPGGSAFASGIDGVADGDSFLVTLTATDTAGLTPGLYSWTELVSKGGEPFDARTGTLTVRPNLASTEAAEGAYQAHDEIELARVRAQILTLTSKPAAKRAFDRERQEQALEQLYDRERELVARVTSAARGGLQRRSIRGVFTRPS